MARGAKHTLVCDRTGDHAALDGSDLPASGAQLAQVLSDTLGGTCWVDPTLVGHDPGPMLQTSRQDRLHAGIEMSVVPGIRGVAPLADLCRCRR